MKTAVCGTGPVPRVPLPAVSTLDATRAVPPRARRVVVSSAPRSARPDGHPPAVAPRAATEDGQPHARSPPAFDWALAEGPNPFDSIPLGGPLPEGYGLPPRAPPSKRSGGVILHPTSLPGPYGMGEIGAQALAFVDWLASAGVGIWQILPLCPPERAFWSPYSGTDALCGNALLLPLDDLAAQGLLRREELPVHVPAGGADYERVARVKGPLLERAARRLLAQPELRAQVERWREARPWVLDSALFATLCAEPELAALPWWEWPEELRRRDAGALQEAHARHAEAVDAFVAQQWLFDRCWERVRGRAARRGVRILGDMPIYVAGHSADVWAAPHLFALHPETLAPLGVSGVPPDAFAADGQLWGSPLHDWTAHADEGWAWWRRRFARCAELYDETRVDHFRAFAGYWAVDAAAQTARGGEWRRGPGRELFEDVARALEEEKEGGRGGGGARGGGDGAREDGPARDDGPGTSAAAGSVAAEPSSNPLRILAEDLGVITPDVAALRLALGAPGMGVLQFAFGGAADNTHLPHALARQTYAYTGTHDNATSEGWWAALDERTRAHARLYLGLVPGREDPAWALFRAAAGSRALAAVAPMQDLLRLGDEARMNTPGRAEGNWRWRMARMPGPTLAAQVREVLELYDRAISAPEEEAEERGNAQGEEEGDVQGEGAC